MKGVVKKGLESYLLKIYLCSTHCEVIVYALNVNKNKKSFYLHSGHIQ